MLWGNRGQGRTHVRSRRARASCFRGAFRGAPERRTDIGEADEPLRASFSILGVEARWTKGPGRQWTIYVSRENGAVLVRPYCIENCDQVLETIFRTLRPTREQSAPPEPVALPGGRFLLRTREFEFESTQELENPDRFSFEAMDRSGELWCSRRSTPDQLDGPEW